MKDLILYLKSNFEGLTPGLCLNSKRGRAINRLAMNPKALFYKHFLQISLSNHSTSSNFSGFLFGTFARGFVNFFLDWKN